MNYLLEAKNAMSAYEANNLNIDTLKAQAHALIAIGEQLEKMNDNVTDIGIVNGWWVLEDRLEHAIRKQQEDK